MKYVIAELNIKDVEQIVAVHIQSFDFFFLTSLGGNFLNTYYSSCLKSSQTIGLGLFSNNGNLEGFAIGSLNSSGYHIKILLNNLHLFFFSLIKIILTRPSVIIRLLLNVNKSPNKKDKKDYAELLSIAVLPNLKGSGYGKLLLNKFEVIAKNRGANSCALTTDFYYNESVISFYKSNNYKIYYDFVTYPSRRMYKMIKNLSN
jgi:ribosomal protein S18 acetylase RimI-like enzyme